MVVAAFITLTLALALLWAPARAWIVPGALALMFALVGGLIDLRGLTGLLAFAAACIAANRARGLLMVVVTHAIMLAIGAGLFLHLLPGIDNPRVVSEAVLSAGAAPYSKYLNFDKGVAGLFLLGLYTPDRLMSDEGLRHLPGLLWRLVVITTVAMALSLALGFLRWDPKLPSWWPLWTWSMIALTALPEEAVFRGVVQTWVARWLTGAEVAQAPLIAMAVAGLLFGIAHIAGGPAYVLLATAAGLGYGWVYASTRSIGASIAAHTGLNIIHFLFFTYPALAHAVAM